MGDTNGQSTNGQSTNFIKRFVAFHEGTEVPGIFAFWCGIASISAALGRRVWIDMGHFTIYPNLYILLVASSGRQRKSTAIDQAEKILRQLNPPPKLLAQKMTTEALIDSLHQVNAGPDGKSVSTGDCVGYVISDEFSNFLNKQSYDAGLAALLIPMFDCKTSFEYQSVGRGTKHIKNACLGILGGTTVDWIKSGIPPEAIGGGLTSRIIFVYCDKANDPVALPELTDAQRLAFEDALTRLTTIAALSGAAKLSPSARDFYVEEYNAFYQKSDFHDERSLAGYASRRGMHLLKIALMLSVAESDDLIIEVNHLDAARKLLEHSEASMKLVLNLITASERGEQLNIVLGHIRASRTSLVSQAAILRAVGHQLTARELAEVLDTLVAMGNIREIIDPKLGKMKAYQYLEGTTKKDW